MTQIISDDDLAALAAPTRDSSHEVSPSSLLEVEFEALMYMLRDGVTALSRPAVTSRLTRLSDVQFWQAVARLTRVSPSNEKPWKPSEIRSLAGDRSLDR